MEGRASALARLKQQQRERGAGGNPQGAAAAAGGQATMGDGPRMAPHPGQRGPASGSAARAHEANERYMVDFHEALRHMGMQDEPQDAPAAAPAAGRPPAQPPAHEQRTPGTRQAPPGSQPPLAAAACLLRPPDKEAACSLGDRPVLCCDVHWGTGQAAVGSSDHAVYTLDLQAGACAKRRTLYTKTHGHSEWVTCVAYLPDGRLVSGGMDNRMWLWPAAGTRGAELAGHSAPVSQVRAAGPCAPDLFASCGYDKRLLVWRAGQAGARHAACLQGQGAPMLQMAWGGGGRLVATGDRSGSLVLWDAERGAPCWRADAAHQGHVTAMAWLPGGSGGGAGEQCGQLLLTGGQDGVLRGWDARAPHSTHSVAAHAGAKGQGAVSDIGIGAGPAAGAVVTTGADQTAALLDGGASLALRAVATLPDFPYSLAVSGAAAAVGCGDGSLQVFDLGGSSGSSSSASSSHARWEPRWARAANAAAVRGLCLAGGRLLATGDDGGAVCYSWQ